MDAANGINLCVAWLALIAAGAILGALCGAALHLADWTRRRRGLRRLESYANHPAHRTNQPRKEER